MKKIIFILILAIAQTMCFGQDNDLPKREAFKLRLAVDSINFYESNIEESSYVLPENTIQLYPGEKIYIEVELKGKTIKSMKTVKQILNPERTITIAFSQQKEDKVHQGMMLSIKNPFDKKLEYQASIFLLNYNKWISTNVFPVEKNLSNFEMWPDLIVTIALNEWKFI